MSKQLLVAGEAHIAPVFFTQSAANAAINGDRIKMSFFAHVSFYLNFGTITSGSDANITVQASDDAAGGNTQDLATLRFRVMSTSDIWSDLTVVTDSKIDIGSGLDIGDADDQLVVVEIDASEIEASTTSFEAQFITLNISAAGGAKTLLVGCSAILRRGRYNTDVPLTALS